MDKRVCSLILFALMICALTACSAKSGGDDISTTEVTDDKGVTHIYQSVTDENKKAVTNKDGDAVLSEIVTDSKGKAVTEKSGAVVTKNGTTSVSVSEKNNNTAKTESTAGIGNDDNEIEFKQDESTTAPISVTEPHEAETSVATTKNYVTTDTTVYTTKNSDKTETSSTEKLSEEEKTTKPKTTQSATDSDGWVTKWY